MSLESTNAWTKQNERFWDRFFKRETEELKLYFTVVVENTFGELVRKIRNNEE